MPSRIVMLNPCLSLLPFPTYQGTRVLYKEISSVLAGHTIPQMRDWQNTCSA